MPKSLYENTLNGNVYMCLGGPDDSNKVEIDGKREYIAGTDITDAEIRENNPNTILIYIG